MLRAGDANGEGYFFDHFQVERIGTDMEVDRLRYSPYGAVNVELRQTTNQPAGLYAPLPPESRNTRPKPFSRDVIADITTIHPALTLGIQHEDGFRSSTIKASWRFAPSARMNWNMVDFDSQEHGPINQETKMNHLELILGSVALADTIPTMFLLRPTQEVNLS
jgi:hypothetical protein